MNRLTRRIGDASARQPWVTIGAWVAALALVLPLAGLVGGSFVDDLVAPGSQSEKAMELLEDRFPEASGGSAVAVFAVPEGERIDRHRPAVEAAVDRIADVEHVATVTDPFTGGTISPDGRIGYVQVAFDVPPMEVHPERIDALNDAIEPVRGDGVVAELGGDAVFINAETPTSGAEAAGLLSALVILVVAFGTIVAALVPIALALVAVAAGLGSIVLLAHATDVSTAAPTIGAMIGLGVGIDYALFIVARCRENRAAGQDNATALSNAMSSSGAAVLFAGGTVVVAMSALALTGLGFLTSIGLSTSLVVLFAVATALTLLPALLSLLGDRIHKARRHRWLRMRRSKKSENPESPEQTAWWRFAHRVSGRPWPYLLAGSAVLLALAIPALRMETGFPDAGNDATSTTHRRAYDLLAEGFGPGFNAPLLMVADLRGPGVDAAGIPELARRVADDPGIASIGEPRFSTAGDTVVLPVLPTTAPADAATSDTLERVRGVIPDNVAVSGLTAMTDDLTRQLTDTLPVFIAAILVVSFLLLMLVFRSVAVPLKAAVMNLLSIGGAYGVVVAVFQWGWLGGLFNLHETMPIASPLPTIFFAVLFGLSMDYEVFLLSRVREEYDATGDPTESVARGMAVTGRVITSAALIMTVVFLSFVANPSPLVKMMGLGLATAIVLDATIVRMVLVPASMALLGRAAWWLPRPLDRRLPRIAVETVESVDAVESNESDDLPSPPEPTPAPTARIS
ncbi:RND superfamily putative drug exporter [Streptomyces umbrinus]|uniref:RND superfamily putative drug exporter n=1 Tax=Streptomyces umbrinus TaxID=67370 RepID=A0ABU0TAK1_9ACTN|nr:MMPL family transporter [Streptomyces umbrinus]MDQ1032837.1 RND superfamily putative drug exporter [Streptomyces umbrinus]